MESKEPNDFEHVEAKLSDDTVNLALLIPYHGQLLTKAWKGRVTQRRSPAVPPPETWHSGTRSHSTHERRGSAELEPQKSKQGTAAMKDQPVVADELGRKSLCWSWSLSMLSWLHLPLLRFSLPS
jgi:hypothetical protein